MLEYLKMCLTHPQRSLSLSSPNNFGKSTLLKEFAQSSVVSDKLIPVYIDFNLRADDSAQAFYELVLRQMLPVFKANRLPVEQLERLYESLTCPSPIALPFNIGRNFVVAMDEALHLLGSPKKRLVLLLDEFDQPLQYLPGLVLLHLRALKDRYPDRLAYVVATFLPILACGRDEQEEGVAEFYELFEATDLIRLGGLVRNRADSLAKQIDPLLTPAQLAQVYLMAGGHPVLTKLVVRKLGVTQSHRLSPDYAEAENNQKEFEQVLKLDGEIRLECTRIWRSLVESEQQALLHYLEGIETLTQDTPLGTLVERGLVSSTEGEPSRIFARTFEWFIRDKLHTTTPVSRAEIIPSPALTEFLQRSPLAYDPHKEVVFFQKQGNTLTLPLTGNAAILFKYLFMRQSEPYCTKDELITAIWGNGGYSAENLDKLVSDLRQEIGDQTKQIIRTIPRRGLQMVGVREWRGR